ncbi:putative phosphatidylserine decarboxylase [Camillea tinctor]|nr:putative phosphatidylserine decarboxylase [Camillea tinctor]
MICQSLINSNNLDATSRVFIPSQSAHILHNSFTTMDITLAATSEPVQSKIVQDLINYINDNGLKRDFDDSVAKALSFNIKEMKILNIIDATSFFSYADKLLKWVPQEQFDGKDVYYHLVIFYFIFNQPPFSEQQTPIQPDKIPLSWVSRWLVEYAKEMGKFLDQPESLTEETLKTFASTPSYKLDNYIKPRGGWKTFNQFFARDFKPGYRTIYGLTDPTCIVSPADCTFSGYWPVDSYSNVNLKGIQWNIMELLQGSRYAHEFHGGVFTHSFLNTFDYHRQHTPVPGRVLEARVIEGQAYLETVTVCQDEEGGDGHLVAHRSVDAPDNPGYQFVQTRGLIVIDSPIGLVAVLPIGMAQVSSVIVTAEKGVSLRKGEEISYFQFGGSDIVMVFQEKSKVALTAVNGVHYSMGFQVGTAKVQP